MMRVTGGGDQVPWISDKFSLSGPELKKLLVFSHPDWSVRSGRGKSSKPLSRRHLFDTTHYPRYLFCMRKWQRKQRAILVTRLVHELMVKMQGGFVSFRWAMGWWGRISSGIQGFRANRFARAKRPGRLQARNQGEEPTVRFNLERGQSGLILWLAQTNGVFKTKAKKENQLERRGQSVDGYPVWTNMKRSTVANSSTNCVDRPEAIWTFID